ncbi:MAG: LUD domain-containing protein [Chloroflexi bacterium]|nr:LUD domain-containing protein [Chloroflexota bacterium]
MIEPTAASAREADRRQPGVSPSAVRQIFAERARRVGISVRGVASDGGPGALAGILRDERAASVAIAENVPGRNDLLAACREAGATLVELADLWVDRRADVGVSVAKLAVAETGSMVVHSPSLDRRAELCVDAHVILIAAEDVRPTLDDALRLIHQIAARPPSYVSLITGPSRTADIEMVPSIGVHGAARLYALVIGAPDLPSDALSRGRS